MRITRLERRHQGALTRFLRDFAAAGETVIPAWFADPAWSFDTTVETLDAWSRGEQLDAGWVPSTTYFVEDEGEGEGEGELLGVANLRHRLTESLERFGGHVGYSVRPSARGRGCATLLLQHAESLAASLGIRRLLLTCGEDNVASRRVIDERGGVLVDTSFYEPEGAMTCRYWIDLPPLPRG